MLAPGNALRMGHSGYATFSNLTFFIFLKNCLFVLFYYFVYSLIAIFLSALLTYGIFNLLNPKIKFNKFPKTIFPKSKENWVDFFFEFKWFLVALSTVLPFILMPNLMARRTVIFFTYFMIVFVITFCIKIFQKSFLINDEVVDTNRISKTSISFSIILIGALIFTIYYLEKGFILKKVIAERENLLNISRGKTVYLKLINQELTSPCYHFSDFYINIPEQDNFIKSSQEEYFGVKIVIEK